MIILTLILGLIALDISLRLYLMSLTVLDARRKFTSKQKKDEEDSQKKKKKAPKKLKRSKFAKRAHKVLVRAGQFAVKNTIRVIKAILRLIRVVITALTSLLGGWVVAVIVIIVALVAVIGSLVSDPELLGTPMSGLSASSKKEGVSSGGSFDCKADISGLDKEMWNKADPIGQQVACNALTVIQNEPNGRLYYDPRVGGTPIGGYDCVRFSSMAMAMSGVSQDKTRFDPVFDPYKQNQDETKWGGPTGHVTALYKGSEHEVINDSGGNIDYSKMLAGDIYTDNQHAVIFLGKGTDGNYYIAHSSKPGATLSTTVEKAISKDHDKSDTGVGLFWDQYGKPNRAPWVVFRPSSVFKEVDKTLYDKLMSASSGGVESEESPKLYTLAEMQSKGVTMWEDKKFTYYSQSVLPGPGLKIPGRTVSSDGYVVDKDGYIVLAAAKSISHGTVFQTPFGSPGKVYDTCASCSASNPIWLDVYTK